VARTYNRTAVFTAAQAATTGLLTVSAITQGNIGIGSVIRNASNAIIGTVISGGTGRGGVGTYNMNTVPAAAITSSAMTANSTAAMPAIALQVPNAYVDKISLSAAGVGYITLTN
jgi:hypothetical protein